MFRHYVFIHDFVHKSKFKTGTERKAMYFVYSINGWRDNIDRESAREREREREEKERGRGRERKRERARHRERIPAYPTIIVKI